MHSGPEQLIDWMRRRGFNQSDASRYLEMDQPHVSMLASGKRLPGLATAIKLERLTGIPVEAWAPTEINDSESAVVGSGRKSHE